MKLTKVIIMILILFSLVPIKVCKAEESVNGVVLIDPGHGGIDGGAKGKSGSIEKDINLEISLKLRDRLEEDGYKVYMTREEDCELAKGKSSDLGMRCKMKQDTNCDAFISIHQNKFNVEKCFGAQVWHANNEKSQKMAVLIQESLKEKTEDNNKRIAKNAKEQYKILRDSYDGACVIVECGFLSNYQEEEKLQTDEHQDKIVDGIACGIDKYFKGNR